MGGRLQGWLRRCQHSSRWHRRQRGKSSAERKAVLRVFPHEPMVSYRRTGVGDEWCCSEPLDDIACEKSSVRMSSTRGYRSSNSRIEFADQICRPRTTRRGAGYGFLHPAHVDVGAWVAYLRESNAAYSTRRSSGSARGSRSPCCSASAMTAQCNQRCRSISYLGACDGSV